VELPEAQKERIQQIAKSHGTSIQALTLAALTIFYGRTENRKEIAFGVPIHKRRNKRQRQIAGMFAGAIPFKAKYDEENLLTDFIQEIKKQQRYDYRFQTFPFTHLNRKLKLFAQGRSYLFDIMVNYEPMNFNLELEGFETETLHFSSNEGSNPLTIRWCDYGDMQPLMIKFDYQCSYLTKQEVKLLADRLLYIIDQFEVDAEKKVGDISILTHRERQLILGQVPTEDGNWFNQGEKDLGNDRPINVRFEEMVKQFPSSLAVVHLDQRWTYVQLNEKANQVAHTLQQMNVQPGHFVGLYAERSPMFIASVLGILKRGAIYVPLDTQNPGERIHKMLANPELQTVVSSAELMLGLEEWKLHNILLLDEANIAMQERAKQENIAWKDINYLKQGATDNPENQNQIDSWAYVLYTSGSTGEPKGAISRHDGAINHMLAEYESMDLAEGFSFLQSAGIGSDISVWQMLGPLLRGGKAVIIDKIKLLDYDCLLDLLAAEEINVLELVPSYIWGLIEHIKLEKEHPLFPQLQWLMLSGEEAPVKMINEWKKLYPKVRVLNAYGPCETSDDVVQYEIKAQMGEEVLRTPIGRVIDNMNVFVLDRANCLAPIGVPGEICITGIGVGAGYWGQAEKTAKVFVQNPFAGTLGSVMYKTGDLGCWLPNGELDFLGRIDRQVKVRGNRVELGEIEAQVRQTPGVKDAHILVHKTADNQELVVAFIVMNTEAFDLPEGYAHDDRYAVGVELAHQELEQALRTFCKDKLPAYMQPNHYCFVEELPTNLSNKVDQNKLVQLLQAMDQVGNVANEASYAAPRNETETKLAKIWQGLLNLDKVGIHDNFFELGGDSIVIIQVVSRAKRMGIQLSPRDMFQFQTIATLVENVEKQVITIQAEQGKLEGQVEFMPIQRRFFEEEHGSMSHYNQSVLLSVDKQVDEATLEQAVRAIVAQHDALRMQFPNDGDYWWQKYGNYAGELEVLNFQQKSSDTFKTAVTETCDRAQASLDIEAGELIRTVLMKAPETEERNRLFIVIHHIVVDGVSWRIIVEDIERAIDALLEGKAIELGHKTSSYRDCVTAQAAYTISPSMESQRDYWKQIVNDNAAFSLPTDHEVGQKQMMDVIDYTVHMDERYTEKLLKKVNRSYHMEINDILLSALSLTLSEWSGQDKVVIGLEGHGREDISRSIDISSTVGWFTSLFPVSIQLEAEMSEGAVIKSVKERLRLLPEKGIGYGLLRYLHPSLETQSELEGKDWEIIFNYLGQFDNLFANSKWFKPAKEDTGKRVGDLFPFNNKFEVNGLILDGKLTMHWTYCTKEYDAKTVEQLAARFFAQLQRLIDHCEQVTIPEYTPSDFGLGNEISVEDLDAFMNQKADGMRLQTQVERLHRLSP
ncbi:MAG: amino acid adenylation domain-containing protein, partial [Bacteroidota bacterium]